MADRAEFTVLALRAGSNAVISNAQVILTDRQTGLPTLPYADEYSPTQVNPLLTDNNGIAQGWLPLGQYSAIILEGGIPVSVPISFDSIPYADVQGSGGDLNFHWNQAIAATTWTINHNLGKIPSVTVFDSAHTQWEGDVQHINTNTCTVTFASAFAGDAYLN